MPKKLCVLVANCAEAGHMHACIGSTSELLHRGHRVIFMTHQSWKGKVAALGFEEHLYCGCDELKQNETPADAVAERLLRAKINGPYSSKEKLANFAKCFNTEQYSAHWNNVVKEAIEKYQPNVIIVDDHSLPPAVEYCGIPWIRNMSMAPLFETFNRDLPPGGSGLPMAGDRAEWAEYNEIRCKIFYSKSLNNVFEKWGYQRYPDDAVFAPTQILTIYATPRELDYPQIRAQINWFNLEAFNRGVVDKIDLEQLVPKSFFDNNLNGKFSGKLICVLMGSLGTGDVELMKRLVAIWSQTNHKYIISKGPHHDKYELPINVWGEKFIDQANILPHADLVITHGGNNTVTEAFAQGKKMLIMPLFLDQYDNAQRLDETGLGCWLNPYTVGQDEMISAIDRLLADEQLEAKLQTAYKRIQTSNAHVKLAETIEQLLLSD